MVRFKIIQKCDFFVLRRKNIYVIRSAVFLGTLSVDFC